MSKRHYMAIMYGHGTHSPVEVGPALGHRVRDTWYHWHGPSRMSWPKSARIVADYGLIDSNDDDGLDALEVAFARQFPRPSGLEAGGGWLAPNGTYYPCEWREHISAAHMLALEIYGTPYPGKEGYGTVERLENLGWVKLYDDLVVPAELTQAQIDTLAELLMLEGQDEKLLRSIRFSLGQSLPEESAVRLDWTPRRRRLR